MHVSASKGDGNVCKNLIASYLLYFGYTRLFKFLGEIFVLPPEGVYEYVERGKTEIYTKI